MKETKIVDHCHHRGHGPYCISWTAIFVGTLVSLGLGLLLNLFGLSIDLVAFRPDAEGNLNLALGGYIGMLIGSIVIMFVSGWVAGYLAYRPAVNERLGSLYGFVTWCLALIIAIFIASHAIAFFNAHYHAMYTNGSDVMVGSNQNVGSTQNVGYTQNAGSNSTVMTTPNADHVVVNNPTKVAGKALFLTFFLFFVGAISSTFGGHCGINSRRVEDPTITNVDRNPNINPPTL